MDKDLYQKAVFMAIRQGLIARMSDASEELSDFKGRDFVLRNTEGKTIAKENAILIRGTTGAPSSFETTQDKAIAWA